MGMDLKFQGDGGIVIEMNTEQLKPICDNCSKKDVCKDECLIYELSVDNFKMVTGE